MSNYIPHYTKKQKALTRQKLKLRRLIAIGADLPSLLAQAEGVRNAQVRMLQARMATFPPDGKYSDIFEKYQIAIDLFELCSAEDMLTEFSVASCVEVHFTIDVTAPSWPIANASTAG